MLLTPIFKQKQEKIQKQPTVSALISVDQVSSLDTAWLNISDCTGAAFKLFAMEDVELSHLAVFLTTSNERPIAKWASNL